jgi:hypothetical protein
MQIYLLAALPCQVKSRRLFKSPNQVPCGRDTTPNKMPITMPITMPYTILNMSSSYITENTIPNKIPTQPMPSQGTQLQ